MSESPRPADAAAPDDQPEFTKEPQPELSLEQRKLKAGWTKNRVGIWIMVGGIGLYMIISGLIGILTKAR